MALGSNIEYKAKALFQAALDEKSAKQVEDRFVKLSKEASEMSKEEFTRAFSSLGQEINKALSKLKLPEINMENLIKLPQVEAFSQLGVEFGTRFAEGFQGAVAGGAGKIDIPAQLNQLEAEKNKLLQQKQTIEKRYNNPKSYMDLMDLPTDAELGDIKPFKDSDIKALGKSAEVAANDMIDDFLNLQDILKQTTKGTDEYYRALMRVAEAARQLYQMQGYIEKNPDKFKNKGLTSLFSITNLSATTSDVFAELDSLSFDADKKMKALDMSQLQEIQNKLSEIHTKQVELNATDIINDNELQTGVKSLDEIEGAYNRILNAKGKIGKRGTDIQNALSFDPNTSKQGIQSLYDAYANLPNDTPWEVQYQALLKYMRLYESYLNSSNKVHQNKVTKPGNYFTKLYEQLKPMAANAENMLRNVLNMANNIPLVGMGGAEVQAKAEAEAKAKADKEAAEAARLSAEEAEKEKIAQEASTKAAQQAAIAATQEKTSKEATAKAVKEVSSSKENAAAINNEVQAQEKLNVAEHQNPSAQDDSGVHNVNADAIEKEAQAQEKLNARRAELSAKFFEPNKEDLDGDYYQTEALEDILAKNQQILSQLNNENLLTEEMRVKYEAINKTIAARIAYQNEYSAADQAASKSFDSLDNFYDQAYATDDPDEANALLEERKRILSEISPLVRSQYEESIAEETNINSLIEQRIALLREAQAGRIHVDDIDDIMMERGGLDPKLERLGDVANDWGSKVKDNALDDDDDAIASLEQFEQVYDRIVLKLANGKNIDILPNAKGLRALYKYADGIDSSSYGESEIEDVEFVRKEAQAHQENTAAINTEVQAQENLNKTKTQQAQIEQSDNDGAEIAEENAKTEAIKQQNGALQENINLKGQANRQGVVTTDTGTGTGTGGTGTTPTKVTHTQAVPDGATSAEAGELEAVRAKVLEVTNAINIKNKAFYNEGQIVGQVVGKENAVLMSLTSNIEAVTSAVKAKNKAFYDEGQIVGQVVGRENAALISLQSNVNNVASSLGGTFSNLQGIRMPNLGSTTSQANITNETQALSDLRTRIDEVTTAVQTKTTSFTQEEATVVQSVGNEINALIQLLQNVNNVNTAITNLTTGLNTALNNAGAFNGINLNVNATVDLTTIETTLANILTTIPNVGNGAQNNNAGGGAGAGGQGGRGGGQRGVAQHRIDKLESDLEKYRSGLDTIGNLTQSYNAELDRLLADLGNLRTPADVSRWQDEFSQFKNIVGMYDNDDKRAVNRMQQATQKDILGNYKEIGKLLAQRENAGSQEEIDSINRRIKMWAALAQEKQNNVNVDKSLRRSAVETARREALVTNAVQAEKQSFKDNAKEKQKSFQQQVKEAQQEAGVSKSKTTVSRAIDALVQAGQIQGITPKQQANLNAYMGKIETLRTTIANFPKDTIASEDQRQQLVQQRLKVDDYTKKIQELIDNYEKLSGPNTEVMGKNILGANATPADYQKQLTNMVMQYTNGKASIKSFDAATNTLKYTMKTAAGEFTKYTASIRQTDNALVTTRGQSIKTMGVMEAVAKKVREYSYYFTGSMMIMRAIGWVREGIMAVKEIDSALIELKKVTDETSASYNKFLDTASAKAEKLGSTITDVISATAEFARTGYDMNTASGLAEAAITYKNVGDGIESASDAAESIISTIKGFGLEATDAMSVVDKFNEVGNNFAIDSKGVGDALMRSASALSAAGNDINESIGLVTAANEVVQDPESVGE